LRCIVNVEVDFIAKGDGIETVSPNLSIRVPNVCDDVCAIWFPVLESRLHGKTGRIEEMRKGVEVSRAEDEGTPRGAVFGYAYRRFRLVGVKEIFIPRVGELTVLSIRNRIQEHLPTRSSNSNQGLRSHTRTERVDQVVGKGVIVRRYKREFEPNTGEVCCDIGGIPRTCSWERDCLGRGHRSLRIGIIG
jgi:hypothetical protein